MPQTDIVFTIPAQADGVIANYDVELGAVPDSRELEVPYIFQTAQNWCWATCAAMLSRFILGNNLTICQAASTLIPNGNCCNGAPPEGTFNPTWDNATCNRTCYYLEVAQLHRLLGMQSTRATGVISFDQIFQQIAVLQRPVEVAFVWGKGHVALVVGVDKRSKWVTINDPWRDFGHRSVPFSDLQSAYGLGSWDDTWSDITSVPTAAGS
jgi:hypothetical protein